MKKTAPLFLAITSCLLLADTALALNMEFYTYGGFNPIVQAFNKVALIFSDANYVSLLTVLTIIGIVSGGISWLATAATGTKIIPLVWLIPVFCGAALYLGLFIPKGNITVYDPVLNRFQTIGSIPDAIVLAAGSLNKIERGVVDIIDTSAAPNAAYSQTAGGTGFKALEAIKDSSPKDNYARTSMIRYIKDCVTFELLRPGTTLSLDNLRNTSTDFLTDLAQAVNPAVFTVYYDSANPAGTALSCTAAWNNLRPIYANPTNYNESIKKVCSKSYFDPSNATELTTCQNLLSNTVNFTTGSTYTPARIIQQRQIAEILYNFYYQDDYETSIRMESDRKITSSGLGLGVTMNEWIPIIRAIMTAVAIGIIPFLALFLPTPILGKAVSLLVGFFVFLATWGVTDAVIHGAAMDYAAYSFEDARQSNLGVYALAAFPSDATKILAMFGVIRSAGIMLASLFSMMLIRFGGSALAHLASNLSGLVQGAGSQAGALLTPEGRTESMNRQIQAAGLLDGMAEHRFSNMAAARSFDLHRSVGGYSAAMNAKNTLQQSGQISPDVTDGEFATMLASAHQTAGTATGPVDVSTGPNGQLTRMKADRVNADGSTSVMTTGAGGTGMQHDITAADNKATYALDGKGGTTTTNASINGFDGVKLANTAMQMKIHGAAHSLASNTGLEKILNETSSVGQGSAANKGFTESLRTSFQSSFDRQLQDGSDFSKHARNDEMSKISAMARAGGSFTGFGFGASGEVSVQGADGHQVTEKFSESTVKALKTAQDRAWNESVSNVASSTQGMNWLRGVAQRVGNTEAFSMLDEARNINRSQQSFGENLTTAMVRDYAVNRYHEETPETIRKSMDNISHFLTHGGAAGVATVNDISQSFLRRMGHQGGNSSAVQSTIENFSSHVAGGGGLKNEVHQATARTEFNTKGVTSDSYTPNNKFPSPPDLPSSSAEVEREANARKEANHNGVKSGGSIQHPVTNAAEKALDFIGGP